MKYDKQIIKDIHSYLKTGLSIKDTCDIVGITFETFNVWRKTRPEFTEAIKKARLFRKAEALKRMQRKGGKSWFVDAWYLERAYPDEFSNRQRHELTGKNGEPVAFRIVDAGAVKPQADPAPEAVPEPVAVKHRRKSRGKKK